MKYAIETFDLKKMYKDFIAVNSINMKVPNKTIFGMLGPNGAGKTTTIKMLTCLALPTSGTAVVGGYDIQKNPDEVRDLLGMVPQQVSLYKDLTVKENAEMCADYYGVPVDEKMDRIDDLMELVDIKYAENKTISQLSGGQKQKASLVASLVHRPDILFLDEPTIGLDPTTKRVLWDLIRELNDNGHTIILCSHDMHEVDMLCDNVGIINTGNLVAYDTPQGLKDTLLKERKVEYEESVKEALMQIQEESKTEDKWASRERNLQLKDLNLREMSVLVNNLDDKMVNGLLDIPAVHSIDVSKNERILLKIESFDDNVVTEVIKSIVNNGGIIGSVSTEEPSLEDVFMRATAEVDEDARA